MYCYALSTRSGLYVDANNSSGVSHILPFDGLWHFFCLSWVPQSATALVSVDGGILVGKAFHRRLPFTRFSLFFIASFSSFFKYADSFVVGNGSARNGPAPYAPCICIGQLLSPNDPGSCTLTDPNYSFEGYIAHFSFWTSILSPQQV